MRNQVVLLALLFALLPSLCACRTPEPDEKADEAEAPLQSAPNSLQASTGDVSVDEAVESLKRFWWLFQEGDDDLMRAAVREHPNTARVAEAIVLQDLATLENMPHLDGLILDRYGGFVSRQRLTELAAKLSDVRHREIPGEDVKGYQPFMEAFDKALSAKNFILIRQLAEAEPATEQYIDRILVEAEEASQPRNSHVFVPWNGFVKLDAAQLVTVAFALGAARHGKNDAASARLTKSQLDKITSIWERLYARGLVCAARMSRGRPGKEWKDAEQSEALHRLLCAVQIAQLLADQAEGSGDPEAPCRLGLSLQGGAWALTLQGQSEMAATSRATARKVCSRPLPWPPELPMVPMDSEASVSERVAPLPPSAPAAPSPSPYPPFIGVNDNEPPVKRFGEAEFPAFQQEFHSLWRTGKWPLMVALVREVRDPGDYFSRFIQVADVASHPGIQDLSFTLQDRQRQVVLLSSTDLMNLGLSLLAASQGRTDPRAAQLTSVQQKQVFAVWKSLFNVSLLGIGAADDARPDTTEPRDKLKQCHEIADLLGTPQLAGFCFAGEAWLAEREGDIARSADLRRRAEEILGEGMPWPPITKKATRRCPPSSISTRQGSSQGCSLGEAEPGAVTTSTPSRHRAHPPGPPDGLGIRPRRQGVSPLAGPADGPRGEITRGCRAVSRGGEALRASSRGLSFHR